MVKAYFAERMTRIKASPSAIMSQHARELKAKGHDIIALSSGEPDFQTPVHVIEAANAAAVRGETKYTSTGGTAEIKDAIIKKFHRENGLDFTPEEIIVGNGTKQIIFNALMAGTNDGQEVILPAPFYIAYFDMVKFAGGIPKIVTCHAQHDFKITPKQLEEAITPRTRWLILNSPCNPSGAVYEEYELRKLADVLLDHPHVGIISDDVYEHMVFDGLKFSSLAAIEPTLKERCVVANGLSKAYAMTGWRIGYAGATKQTISEMFKLQSLITSGANSIAQAAAVAALNGPQEFLKERADSFEGRRNLVVSMLNQAEGLECKRPGGAFYVYPSCANIIGKCTPSGAVIKNDEEFVRYLLETEDVATVHGNVYGLSPHFRISYATDKKSLIEACERIQHACALLR